MNHDTRSRIIVAANEVVRHKGVVRLTLDEVARVASVSKGGLLYHFASKELLIEAMLTESLNAFEAQLKRKRGIDRTPGSWLRAYIKASFPADGTFLHQQSMVGPALLATIGNDPTQAGLYRSHLRRWIECAAEDGVSPAVAETIRLAVDALWLHEAFGIQPHTGGSRSRMIQHMLEMTRVPVAGAVSRDLAGNA